MLGLRGDTVVRCEVVGDALDVQLDRSTGMAPGPVQRLRPIETLERDFRSDALVGRLGRVAIGVRGHAGPDARVFTVRLEQVDTAGVGHRDEPVHRDLVPHHPHGDDEEGDDEDTRCDTPKPSSAEREPRQRGHEWNPRVRDGQDEVSEGRTGRRGPPERLCRGPGLDRRGESGEDQHGSQRLRIERSHGIDRDWVQRQHGRRQGRDGVPAECSSDPPADGHDQGGQGDVGQAEDEDASTQQVHQGEQQRPARCLIRSGVDTGLQGHIPLLSHRERAVMDQVVGDRDVPLLIDIVQRRPEMDRVDDADEDRQSDRDPQRPAVPTVKPRERHVSPIHLRAATAQHRIRRDGDYISHASNLTHVSKPNGTPAAPTVTIAARR